MVLEVGTFAQLKTCAPFFVRSNAYIPARFAVVSGSLPPGLSLWGSDAAAAQLNGTPTAAGVYTFTIAAAGLRGGRASATYTATIYPELVFGAGGPLADLTVGVPYSASVSASGGEPPYSYSGSNAGLTVDPSTGVISGTVAAPPPGAQLGLVCGTPFTVRDAAGMSILGRFSIPAFSSSGDRFNPSCDAYTDPYPFVLISRFAPTRGGIVEPRRGVVTIALVTIAGEGLSKVTEVTFGGKRAVFTIDSDKRITAIPPIGLRSGPVVVTTSHGRVTASGDYTVTQS